MPITIKFLIFRLQSMRQNPLINEIETLPYLEMYFRSLD